MKRIELQDVKKGDVVWECESGANLRAVAQEDAIFIGDGWSCSMLVNGESIPYFVTADKMLSHYGPKLYDSPQYIPFKHCMSPADYDAWKNDPSTSEDDKNSKYITGE